MTAINGPPADKVGRAKKAVPKGRNAKRLGAAFWLHALDILVRSVAAIGGGYLVTALATAVLARLLPGPRVEATIGATTFSFVIYVTVVTWAFAARKTWRLCAELAAICAGLAAVLVWALGLEPRL